MLFFNIKGDTPEVNKSIEIKPTGRSASSDATVSTKMREKATVADFIQLTKPGIIRSNLLAAFGGFWLASGWNLQWNLLLYMLIGTSLVMASSCVLNNYWDRDLDGKMERTKGRVLPSGKIAPNVVLWYGILLGLTGLAVLYIKVNFLTVVLGIIGMFVYVVIYTMWLKRTSTWSTSVGGISGAMPPLIGYCAVNPLDMGAFLLFAVLFLWQPPHFWSLGIRRKEDYRNAGYPLLPVVKGVKRTKLQMIPYIALMIPTTILLYAFQYVGMIYLVSMLLLELWWLYHTLTGVRIQSDEAWARKSFIFSVQYLMIHFVVMIVDTNGALSTMLMSWIGL